MDASDGAPLSERVCDAGCLAFALWTLCCHAVVALGGNLFALMILFAAVLGVNLTLAVRYRTVLSERRPPVGVSGPPRWSRTTGRWLRAGGATLGLGASVMFFLHRDFVLLWWSTVALLGAVAVVTLFTDKPRLVSPVRARSLEILLWVLALLCVLLTLVSHRPDVDDAFYVNVAVAAADFPDRALLSGDTLHGIEGLPLHLPVYRVHTYELLNGALSYLTGVPAIYCFHWIAAAVAALFVPLASAKLFRLLTPRSWLWAVLALMVVLVSAGETHRWYGNFAFVRMWQGKSIFLFVFLPLIYVYALRFALYPTRRGWVLLCAAQIAAVGCSSSAIWAAPAGALMALCCVLSPSPEGLRSGLLGALASAYVLAVGWIAKGGMTPIVDPIVNNTRYEEIPSSRNALVVVLGDSRLLVFGVVSILTAWAFCSRSLVRRFAVLFPLVVSLTLLNPYTIRWVSGNVTGPSHWRSMWALPLPVLMTLLLLAPLRFNAHRSWRVPRWGGCIVLLASFAVLIPRYNGLSPENRGVWLGWPTLKVDLPAYRWAAALNGSLPAGAYVIAPPEIDPWIVTFHHHVYPIHVRVYLQALRGRIGEDDYRFRNRLRQAVDHPDLVRDSVEILREGLDRFSVDGVCLRKTDQAVGIEAILQQAEFRKTLAGKDYEIWIREHQPAGPRDSSSLHGS